MATDFPKESGKIAITAHSLPIDIFTYRPGNYLDGPLIVVHHGVLRNAETYRDHAKPMADRFGALIAAPLFDLERFPTAKYQQGGVVLDGVPQPRDTWTYQLVPQLLSGLRVLAGRSDLPVYLIGHSGGGQFLARMAAFQELKVRRIVAANPGTHLFLNREHGFPYAFGGLPDEFSNDEAFRRYLAQPLTLYLGTGDIIRDENFEQTPAADRQGMSRYERGRRAYFRGRELANERNWEFGWRLVEAPGIPHDHERMFDHAQCAVALFGDQSG